MATETKYLLVDDFSAGLKEEAAPCIYLQKVVDRRRETVWKQEFSDSVQRDATFSRLCRHESKWSHWGAVFSEKGAGSFTKQIMRYYLDLDDIYPSRVDVQKEDICCIFLAGNDEDNPNLIMFEVNGASRRRIGELVFRDNSTRDWAHSWLVDQANKSSTFLRILKEDGERGLQTFLDLIVDRLRPDGQGGSSSVRALPTARNDDTTGSVDVIWPHRPHRDHPRSRH
jgi:hypothetical protein